MDESDDAGYGGDVAKHAVHAECRELIGGQGGDEHDVQPGPDVPSERDEDDLAIRSGLAVPEYGMGGLGNLDRQRQCQPAADSGFGDAVERERAGFVVQLRVVGRGWLPGSWLDICTVQRDVDGCGLMHGVVCAVLEPVVSGG